MAIVVEHEKRKREILEKSLQLFCEEGYEDVTYQKIADRCNITRTTLYIYFKNKKEIFLFSIKQFTKDIEKDLLLILKEENNSIDTLKKILMKVLEHSEKNKSLFKILLPYLTQVEKSGGDVNEKVKRRVIRIQHFMSTVIINGQKKGEIKKLPVKEINDLLYGLLESGLLRLSLLNYNDLTETKASVNFAVEQFRA
ncbi:MAG: TetR/AcrR family transcriptional regulator [Treponema sp.]|nr:TetR/AcrR family transcriptional regulator [Treponema sp.]